MRRSSLHDESGARYRPEHDAMSTVSSAADERFRADLPSTSQVGGVRANADPSFT
jgi:hypothetical protein